MGCVMMSERELNRVEVLAQVDDGRSNRWPDACGWSAIRSA